MPLTYAQVEHIAALARLELDADELERYRQQLSSILDDFAQLQTVEVADDELSAPAASANVLTKSALRADQPQPGLELEAVLKNAPATQAGQFLVPAVFD